ncbi:MAG: hypothetical protein A2Z29_06795 [Chloroflexi bacterium RBG_16_56_11]|nr:MAG: hypothetical protein A2Z29_06795 [Chloroflexi bacterium RBG_16_56_11]
MKAKSLLIIVLVVALLAGYYWLGTDYLRQRRDNRGLTAQIADNSVILSQLPKYPADLKEQQAAAQAGLDTARKSFPQNLNSTRIINTILEIAGEMEVKAVPLVTQPWTSMSTGEFSYSVFRLNVMASGTYTRVSGFLERLETGELETLVVENISVDRPGSLPGINEVSEADPIISADLDLAIYSRPPTTD